MRCVAVGGLALVILLAGGCSAPTEATTKDRAAETPPVSKAEPSPSGSFGDGGQGVGAADDCAAENRLVYTLDSDKILRVFDPITANFTVIGALDCPTDAGTNSMAVDRAGNAWVLYDDGTLFKASTKDASCEATSFRPGQEGIWTFGMGFSTDAADGKTETLFIAGYPPTPKLAKLSLDSMSVTVVGELDRPARAELSGTGSGRLFALFDASSSDAEDSDGLPFAVAEIDKASSAIVSVTEQTTLPRESLNFAFAAWGGDFYLFVYDTVYRYRPSTNATTTVATVPFLVVGAGVSTCAPHAAVK